MTGKLTKVQSKRVDAKIVLLGLSHSLLNHAFSDVLSCLEPYLTENLCDVRASYAAGLAHFATLNATRFNASPALRRTATLTLG